MSTKIFYFSATGNSLQISRMLAEQLGDATVIAVPKAMHGESDFAADRIGLVFPVYLFGMPAIMVNFVKQLTPAPGTYLFAMATYNGMTGQTLRQTEKLLNAQGVKLSAGFGINMPGNATMAYDAWPVQKQEKAFAAAKDRIVQIAQMIRAGSDAGVEKHAFLMDLLYASVYRLLIAKLRTDDKSFWVEASCHGCGICQRVCPVGNITMTEGKPVWQHHCEQCLACFHWCPKAAIQIKKSTLGRTRYHHPNVNVSDILLS